jgi:hypothetical protein
MAQRGQAGWIRSQPRTGEFSMSTDLNAGDGSTVAEQKTQLKFSSYQKFVVALLAFLQFSIILDS